MRVGQDILKLGEFDFSTPMKPTSLSVGHKASIVSDEALLQVMESVKKQIAIFEQTSIGYKTLIATLLKKLKDVKSGEGASVKNGGGERGASSAGDNGAGEAEALRKKLAQVETELRAAKERSAAEISAAKGQLEWASAELERERKSGAVERERAQQEVARLKSQVERDTVELNNSKSQLAKVTKELMRAQEDADEWKRKADNNAKSVAAAPNVVAKAPEGQFGNSDERRSSGGDLDATNKRLTAELRAALAKQQELKAAAEASEAKAEKLRGEMANFIKSSRQSSSSDISHPSSADAQAEIKKLKADLTDEKQLSARLRQELQNRTKEALAAKEALNNASGSGSGNVNSNKGVVLDSPAEWQRMNELELRSRLNVLSEYLNAAKRDSQELQLQMDRLSERMQQQQTVISQKDKNIADLTVKLSEAVTSKAPADNTALANSLQALEKKQDKMDADMELMEENLMLQASVAEKDEMIANLKSELAKLKK